MRLINANHLIKRLQKNGVLPGAYVIEEINRAPTVDAIPVIRCKDCERYQCGVCTLHGGQFSPDAVYVSENGYCSSAKKRKETKTEKRGKWVMCESFEHWKCSECGHRAPALWVGKGHDYAEGHTLYCPHCGARMEE